LSQGSAKSTSRLWPLIFLALTLGLGLGTYARYTQRVVEGWDPLAYLYAGQRIVEGKGPTLCHPYNEVIGPYFTLAGFNVRVKEGACLYLNYPPGFPLLLAVAQILTGSPDAALYVPALLGALGTVMAFGLGAVMFDRWVGLVGALVLALMPTYLAASTSPWSDLAGTVFVMGGMVLYLWAQSFPVAQKQRSALLSMVGGGLVVYGVFVRYTNVFALLPLVLYILSDEMADRRERHQKGDAFKRKSHWLFAGVVVLGLLGILGFNRVYFGGYLTTGYSPRHGWYTWPAFSMRYLLGPSPVGGKSLPAALETLGENLGWLLIPGAIGLIAMPHRKRLMIAGLILCFVLLYGLYAFPARDVNARFLLPAFPALALAVAYGLRHGMLRWGPGDWKGRLWSLTGGALLVVALGLPLPGRLQELQERNTQALHHVQAVQSLAGNSESDAVFLAYGWNDTLFFYGKRTSLFYRRIPPLDPVTGTYRWNQLEARLVEAVTELLRRGVPVYYVQDSDPPFADSLNILLRHFRLSPQESTTPPVYRIH
jgi:hypothetical protein